ncbi:MAG: hypothetical protein ACR2ML_08410 [Solirubrobacteraceae bacterium]
MTPVLSPAAVRTGAVRGRYFRENFAQGGIDLVQIVPELATNADAAIAASGRGRGRIDLRVGEADPAFMGAWRRELRSLGVPALLDWRFEVCCADDGEGVDASVVDRRLGALGVLPEGSGQRGLFGRGLRDVWLAQGGGRIQGVRGGRAVESWFFPAAGDDPYAFAHVLDGPASEETARALGLAGRASGSRVTVPLALKRLPPNGRLRTLISHLVQLRPVLEDPDREVWLELPGELAQRVVYPAPEPDPERPVLLDETVEVASGVQARILVRRAAEPIPPGPSRATRRAGLVVRSGRAAHESTLGGLEGRQGARHLYGEVVCEAIEDLQREALDSPRPQVVVRVDRGGLNEHHPIVGRLHAAIERALKPIVAAEERRAGAHLVSAGRAVKARDEVGLRALNDALRAAFDAPGSAGFARGGDPSEKPSIQAQEPDGGPPRHAEDDAAGESAVATVGDPVPELALRFKQSPVRLHPGEQRTVSLLFDPERIEPGTAIDVLCDAGLTLRLWEAAVPEPGTRGWSRVSGTLRARVTVEPGARLSVLAQAGEHGAELDVLIVSHRANGWVREIARKDEDAVGEAQFDPESGVVTVFEGRREFRALARAARQAGLSKRRAPEYLPYRMLEVEVAANAVYGWAAERIVERRLTAERPADPAEYARAIRDEAQTLRHRFHERLMRAFLEPEVFDGAVQMAPPPGTTPRQLALHGLR